MNDSGVNEHSEQQHMRPSDTTSMQSFAPSRGDEELPPCQMVFVRACGTVSATQGKQNVTMPRMMKFAGQLSTRLQLHKAFTQKTKINDMRHELKNIAYHPEGFDEQFP